jgi:hypothetical protein
MGGLGRVVTPIALASIASGMVACSAGAGSAGQTKGSSIRTRLTTTAATSTGTLKTMSSPVGKTAASGLEYFITGITICESLDVQGTGFHNGQNCLDLYQGDSSVFAYDPSGDLSPLADVARRTTTGFVDLMNGASLASIGGDKTLTHADAHGYSWGTITWAPPIKVRATVPLNGGGATLFTHDGLTTFTLMPDGFRDYYTVASPSMLMAPAESAVALLPNGGNWFKFQSPLVITSDDIDQGKTWVLDLVFNPDGLVQGMSVGTDPPPPGVAVRDLDSTGATARGITVPMLDLAPVPHRQDDAVVRESYFAPLSLDGSPFEVRLELYSLANDPGQTIYGVGIQSLLTTDSSSIPPTVSKISFVGAEPAGTIAFESWSHTPILTGFSRGQNVGDTTTASLVCATTADPAVAMGGGSAFVVNACPGSTLAATFTLTSKTTLAGSILVGAGGGPDAGGSQDGGPGGGQSDAASE